MYLMFYKGFWVINNDIFKKLLVKKYHSNHSEILELHEKIADTLDKTPNSVRKLEE